METPKTTNETRAHRADMALSYYVQEQLGEAVYSQDSLSEHVTDLLSDMMHFCQSKGLDFNQSLRMAKTHYEVEKPDESRDANHAPCVHLADCGDVDDNSTHIYCGPCCDAYTPVCHCGGRLELIRTVVVPGVTQDVYECEECDNDYVRDTSDPASKIIEYAVPCCMCHNLVPKSSAHLITEKDGYGHFIGECCWDERLRD